MANDKRDEAVNELLKGASDEPKEKKPEAKAPGNDTSEERVAALEAAVEALTERVEKLEKALAATPASGKKPETAQPYSGPTETLIHPLGHEIKVKTELVESALKQGFKRPEKK